jgi:hypothetical protein
MRRIAEAGGAVSRARSLLKKLAAPDVFADLVFDDLG